MSAVFDRRFLSFVLVGVSNTVVGYAVIFFCLNVLEWGYLMSTLLGYVIGFINGFWLNRKYTFQNRERIGQTIWKYLLCFAVSYAASYFAGLAMADQLADRVNPVSEWLSRDNVAVIAGAIVFTLTNYVGNKYFTFARNVN